MANSSEWKMGDNEIGKTVGVNKGSKYKMYVAKLMPLITFAKPKVTKTKISATCYCNNSSCKPKPATIVSSRNYVEINLSNNSYLDTKATVKHGKKFQVSVKRNDPDTMTVLCKKDKNIN